LGNRKRVDGCGEEDGYWAEIRQFVKGDGISLEVCVVPRNRLGNHFTPYSVNVSCAMLD